MTIAKTCLFAIFAGVLVLGCTEANPTADAPVSSSSKPGASAEAAADTPRYEQSPEATAPESGSGANDQGNDWY